MSLTTLIYLLAATVVTGLAIGYLADMEPGETAAGVGLMAFFALSMYGLVGLLA